MTVNPSSRPWIIWIEPTRSASSRAYMLLVYKPRHRRFLSLFSRWSSITLVHSDGPIYFSTDAEEALLITELVEAGMSYVPDNVRAMTAMSLSDVHEIIDDSLKPVRKAT